MATVRITFEKPDFAHNSPFKSYITELDNRGTTRENNGYYVQYLIDERDVNVPTYIWLLANGIAIDGFKSWIYADVGFLNLEVFEGLRNRETEDLQINNFSNWNLGNNAIYYSKDNRHILLSTFWNGEYSSSAEISVLLDNNIQLLGINEVNKLLHSSEFANTEAKQLSISQIYQQRGLYQDMKAARSEAKKVYLAFLSQNTTESLDDSAEINLLKQHFSQQELEILARWGVLRQSLRRLLLGEVFSNYAGNTWDDFSIESRSRRYRTLKQLGKRELDTATAFEMGAEFDQFAFEKSYIENGIEGNAEVGTEGVPDPTHIPTIRDYINGKFFFQDTGLPAKNFTPLTMSKEDFISLADQIIAEGVTA